MQTETSAEAVEALADIAHSDQNLVASGAGEAELSLLFISDYRIRPLLHMGAGSRVAGAVNPHCDNWDEVRG